MRYWPTLLMALVLGGLGLYLYLVEFPAKETEERQTVEKRKVLLLDQQALTGLAIKTDQSELVFGRTGEKGWTITSPLQTDADQREVQSLIRALVTGSVHRIVEENPTTLSPFGLDSPVTTITITTGAAKETLSIGDSGPLSSTLYVLRESDHALLLTDMAPKDFVNKNLMTFRRKDILRIAKGDVDRIRLTYPTTEIVLYNVNEKPKPKWKIRYPIEAEADLNEVRMLLFRLEDLKALGIIDPGPERDTLAKTLHAPKVKVTIHAADGDQTVKLYQPDPSSGEAIAETTSDAPLYRINPTAIRDLTKELFNLQDKRLLGVDAPDIAMLSVKTATEQYVLINQSGEWVLEDRPADKVNQQTADLFVSRVVNVPAEERVMKQSGPLAPYGLVSPAAEFVATGRDGKLAGKLSLGSQSNGLAYAMGHRLQGIYQIRADLLKQIPSKKELLGSAKEGESSVH
ncbi:conserved protein of unknown function [Nitrospira japonica]|uniref:DUF4340 domain-containing protein n=1 Tax=Nitrospira japonica TaxID=1325564 RepID=A0A1W1I6A9_9BACT|nr:DUF4340 domain-containing protein [Nitrospira japonica]SLM48481.1 conserved protein of unknown function [Nitrospira japonica]